MKVAPVISMLHEGAQDNSALRLFRGRPVLSWTVDRLARASLDVPPSVVCWTDQLPPVRTALGEGRFAHLNVGNRVAIPAVEAVSAAQRWADGWRGGLLSTCWFDRGFHAGSVLAGINNAEAEAALLVDPAAALVDPDLIAELVAQAEAHPDRGLVFMQAAPGLSGVLLRKEYVAELAKANLHPGRSLHYVPDVYGGDPIATPACAPSPTVACRTLHRFTLDSAADVARLDRVTAELNGSLISTGAEELARLANADRELPALPRDLRIELTTRRATKAIFRAPGTPRAEKTAAEWAAWFAAGMDPRRAGETPVPLRDGATRITFAGAGDPLLHEGAPDVIAAARAAGHAVSVETDLVGVRPEVVDGLARSGADLVLAYVPGVSPQTYQAVMGVDALNEVLANMQRFLTARGTSPLPLLVPCLVKTTLNAGEMEPWYDHWLRLMGSAVIEGATDYAGAIPDVGVARMDPSTRVPCRRLSSRVQVLCDGSATQCEFDVAGKCGAGNVFDRGLADVWHAGLAPVREAHSAGRYSLNALCGNCKEWHRP